MHHRGPKLVRSVALAALTLGLLASCSGGSSDGGSKGATTSAAPDGSTTAAGSSSNGDGGEFSLLSYNVAGLPQEISKEHPEVNIPKISPLLEPYDVVLTQEDFDWWKPGGLAAGTDFVHYHERLRADVTHEFRTEQHPGPEAVGIDIEADRPNMELGDGLGVLSRLPLGEVTRVPWTECYGEYTEGASDCLAMKGFLMTTIELDSGLTVDLYDLHGEAGGSEQDQALQVKDYQQLAAYIVEHSEDHAVIVAGDTNLHTDLEHEDGANGQDVEIWDTFLEATGLTDSCAATDCADPGRIDKVAFRSNDDVELTASSYRFRNDLFVDDDGNDLSDHQPLEVVFAWAPR